MASQLVYSEVIADADRLRWRIEADGNTLVLTTPQPEVLRISEITGLTEMFSPAPI